MPKPIAGKQVTKLMEWIGDSSAYPRGVIEAQALALIHDVQRATILAAGKHFGLGCNGLLDRIPKD